MSANRKSDSELSRIRSKAPLPAADLVEVSRRDALRQTVAGAAGLWLANRPGVSAAAPAPPEKAPEGEMGFDGLVVDPDHFKKVFQRLVGLLVEQEIESFQIIDIERRWRLFLVAFAETPHSPTRRRKQQKQAREEKCGFSRHRIMAGCAKS